MRAALVALAAFGAWAQEREQEIFGPQPAPKSEPSRLEQKAAEEPLKIGGQLYLRSLVSARQGQPPSEWTLSSPQIVDAYLDARPNDRVRGFLLGRMFWDPTVNAGQPGQFGIAQSGGPTVLLDQLWVAFDVARTVFVTAGRQHVKWGTGRFWSPTDWLHPLRRDPLTLFDSRTGTTMLRLHLPWEKRGWNFTAVALLEGAVQAGTQVDTTAIGAGTYANADRIGKVAGAARAELVLGTLEVGLDAIVRRGNAKGGVDFSAGIWELDVHGEVAIKTGSDVPLWQLAPGGTPGDLLFGYQAYQPTSLTPAATLGLSWSYKYSDEDTVTLGAEYFYNANGYDDAKIYPFLLLQQFTAGAAAFNPFYLGRHYTGAFLFIPRPGRWNDTTITLSTLGNLSDRSFVSRLDWQVGLLTYLGLEIYGQVHYGNREGELRFGLDLPPFQIGGETTPAIHLAPPAFALGVNLRLKI